MDGLTLIRHFALLLFGLFGVACSTACAGIPLDDGSGSDLRATITTRLSVSQEGHWQVQFVTSKAVTSLEFRRSPDDSRTRRWQSDNKNLQITLDGDAERISRVDGKPFSEAKFSIDSQHISLPKEYTPFAHFSDGGTLVHSGRFFVCAETCHDDHNLFAISIDAPAAFHILFNDEHARGHAAWVDRDAGQKIYVGPQIPTDTPQLSAVIDPGLPEAVHQRLSDALPTMMSFFESKLGPLPRKPLLFASIDRAPTTRVGRQGGTLPDQIFMHWFGRNTAERITAFDTLWFFAHEVAHLYQGEGANVTAKEQQWIHEGAAEVMAAQAIIKLYSELGPQIISRQNIAVEQCLEQTKDKSIEARRQQSGFGVHYTCGTLIWLSMASSVAVDNASTDVFALWNTYQSLIKTGQSANIDTLAEALKPGLPKLLGEKLVEAHMLRGVDFYAPTDNL